MPKYIEILAKPVKDVSPDEWDIVRERADFAESMVDSFIRAIPAFKSFVDILQSQDGSWLGGCIEIHGQECYYLKVSELRAHPTPIHIYTSTILEAFDMFLQYATARGFGPDKVNAPGGSA